MHGNGFSSREFGFIRCVMGVVLDYYILEMIKFDCLWCVTLSWLCVALSGGVLYKFDAVCNISTQI